MTYGTRLDHRPDDAEAAKIGGQIRMRQDEGPVDTDGGPKIEGGVQVHDGDLVGRDKTIHGDQVRVWTGDGVEAIAPL